MLRRRAIRGSLTEWARHNGFEPAAHHQLLIAYLEKVARGEIDRLLVCMPPGSAKSTYASVLFPPWFMANCSGASILAASHTSELSEYWGRRVRNMIAEDGATLGIDLRSDSQAAGRWQLDNGGEYLAAGVGQAILGFRTDLGIIDDPFRSKEDAASEVVRRTIWEWFRTDLMTRLKPKGRLVVVTSRLHEDDMAGRIQENMERGGAKWEMLILPAMAENDDPLGRRPGEYLWDADPAYEYGDYLRRNLEDQTPGNWAAMFQQRPAPESGTYFKAEWLKPYLKMPELSTLRIYGASDYAVTSKGGDWTVHVVVGVDPDLGLWLLDLWRGQETPDVWVEQMLDMADLWKPYAWAEEAGQIRASIGPFLDRRMQERKVYVARHTYPTKHDKAVRAQSIRARMALEGLNVPTRAPWYAAFQQELLTFPVAKHDDQVDALGLIGQMLAEMVAGIRAKKLGPKKPSDGYVDFEDEADLRAFERFEGHRPVSLATY